MSNSLPSRNSVNNSIKARRKRSDSQLQFEKCEPRNMLSVAPGADFAAKLASFQEADVLNYLVSQRETAYLQSGHNQLQLVESNTSDRGATSVFQQTIHGLPVHGAFVTVVQDGNHSVQQVIDGAFSGKLSERVHRPAIGLEIAQPLANRGVDTKGLWSSSGELVWFTTGDSAQLAWEVQTSVEGVNVNNTDLEFVTVVDASDATILSQVQAPSSVDQLLASSETGVFPRIVINDDIGPQGSRDYAAPFDSVVSFALGCTGALIAENVVISARHCGIGAGDQVEFGDNSNSPDFTTTVQSSTLPDGSGTLLDGGDVAIVVLNDNVPASIATPMRFIDATDALEGQLAVTAGYGYNGVGSVGHEFTADGFRWGGENIIDVYGAPAGNSGENIISTDFDDGTAGANTISGSSATPLEFEATTAPGDSGGAVFVQQGGEWLIAGVLSGGTSSTSVYGDISWWTGTAIYRNQIESFGGQFAGGGLGSVSLDQDTYFTGDTIQLSVVDDNAVAPVTVTLTSDSGDTETITLTDTGSGTNFTGSIVTSGDAVSGDDGVLQVSDLDQVVVTYSDPDDGSGGTADITDSATVFAEPGLNLVGVDFDQSGSPSPTNWTSKIEGGNGSIFNLGDELGLPTQIDLAIEELADGSYSDFAVTPAANTIPTHANDIANIDGQIYTGADPLRLTYSELKPDTNYEVYVLAAEGFFDSIQQDVTITGSNSVSFTQDFAIDTLFINDAIGDSTKELSEYAVMVTSNAAGEIVIDVTPVAGTSDVVLAGVAIQEVPDWLDADARKILTGSATSGSLDETVSSDDAYYNLSPAATSNLNKQRVDVILLTEYTGPAASELTFRVEASMSGGVEGDVIQEIELYNQVQDEWVLVDSRMATNVDSVVEVSPSANASDFINSSSGLILSRVVWSSPGFTGTPFTWTVSADEFGLDIV